MERDIFEDVRIKVGCEFISDLPYRKHEVFAIMHKIDFSNYEPKNVVDLLTYIFR